ncbi:hypothetical protein BDD26_0638 [Xenorhabdus cabanillasii]|uniref:Uncharacterized protein n=1 Tax=Xenorhabdus cabanillasii TaxID=351673 RepID=A0A3D9UDT1_9GAMM|nr:hypothetical protein BDD26_0638 [Xenorhabdus cabanillasii]
MDKSNARGWPDLNSAIIFTLSAVSGSFSESRPAGIPTLPPQCEIQEVVLLAYRQGYFLLSLALWDSLWGYC